MALQVETLVVGMLQVNCHLIRLPGQPEGYIVDPGGDADQIISAVDRLGMRPVAVLLTHAHVDHISGVGRVTEKLGIPVYVHPDDHRLYASPGNALPPFVPAAKGLPEPVTEAPAIDGVAMEIIHTPGHTRGGVCFHFPDDHVLISGDTLFAGSIGRTDLPGGDMPTLLRSIRERLLTLPPETRVYTGHGPTTTIAAESASNPFL